MPGLVAVVLAEAEIVRCMRVPVRRLRPASVRGASGSEPWHRCIFGRERHTEVPLTTLLARGLYSLPGAARLLATSPAQLRRWAFGYERGGRRYEAVIHADLEEVAGQRALTFLDLVELMFIKGLRDSGHSFPRIHEAHGVLSRLLETEHPFALRRAFSDPAGIYTLLEREDHGDLLVELKGAGQIAMWPTLQRYLKQLEFDVDDLAERWYPAGPASPVVVDPRVSFGAPVVTGTRIETAAIAELYQGEDSIEEIAWLFDLAPAQVKAAIEFERSLAA
jgi:uncharacterized protein (DUF433 family)